MWITRSKGKFRLFSCCWACYNFLERNRLIRISDVNPAKIAIILIGIDKCNEPTDIEWSYNHTFYPIEDDDDIAKPGHRNYK